MSFVREFKYAFISLLIIPFLLLVFSFVPSIKLQLIASLLSIIIGSALIIFGFWGADFAFGVVSGEIHQAKEKGLIKGARRRVYVPFMRNYTPLEWWNLNWYMTFLGCILLSIGMLIMGLIFGVFCTAIGNCQMPPSSFSESKFDAILLFRK